MQWTRKADKIHVWQQERLSYQYASTLKGTNILITVQGMS